MEELGELLHMKFPEGDYDTVAGFLMDQLGRIPDEDEHPVVAYGGAVFTIQKVDDRRIELVHVEVPPPPPPEEEPDEKEKEKEKSKKEKEK